MLRGHLDTNSTSMLKYRGLIRPGLIAFALLMFLFKLDSYLRTVANPPLSKRLKITVYYETKCPDSKRFLQEQVRGAIDFYKSTNLRLKLVPYGKASVSLLSNNLNGNQLFDLNFFAVWSKTGMKRKKSGNLRANMAMMKHMVCFF